MSRNFDLITEIEHERELITMASHPQVSTDRSVVKEAASQDAENREGKEIVSLVQGVFLSTSELAPRKVVFCGVDEENGSSSVCARVGRILASKSSKSVCMVDANLRRRSLSRILGVDTTIRTSGKSSSGREQCTHIGGNLWLAETDQMADVLGLILSEVELKHRLTQLDSTFDFLLIDAPGLNASSDAALLGQIADAAILVIEAGITRRTSAVKAKEALNNAGARLLGTVLHNRTFPIPETIYKRI